MTVSERTLILFDPESTKIALRARANV